MVGMGEDRQAGDRPAPGRRVSVSEAAGIMGISVEAVRGRIKRGTIGHERDGGRVYVVLDTDRPSTGRDQGDDHTTDRPELVELLRDQVEDLRTDRDAWRDQARRSDYLLGSSMERTRELESRLRELEPGSATGPTEAAESPESPGPSPSPADAGDGPERPAQPTQRSWWRRLFEKPLRPGATASGCSWRRRR
jgi:hypothetical protein